MQPRLNLVNNGQELNQADVNTLAQVASAADDQALAEMLRVYPGGLASVSKYIAPYAVHNPSGVLVDNTCTVQGAGGTGSVTVNPFRAIVGSRTAPGTNAPLAWADLRSQYFLGSATSLAATVALAANSSGNPRWDLIVAAVQLDSPTASVTRYVKPPTSKVVTPMAVSVYLQTTVTVAVVTGTPGATPTIPALPADTSTTFYIPLAAIRVPNGFTVTSTVSSRDIRDQAPVIPLSKHLGVSNIQPANGNNDGVGTYATNFGWAAGSAGTRPSVFLPPSMLGGETRIIEVDCSNGTPSLWSHTNGSVVDNSIDWRNRFTRVTWQVESGNLFANDPTAGSSALPLATVNPTTQMVRLGNTFKPDAQLVAGDSSVLVLTPSDTNQIASGAEIGLYVDSGSGALKFFGSTGTPPQCRLFAWLEATAYFPNY